MTIVPLQAKNRMAQFTKVCDLIKLFQFYYEFLMRYFHFCEEENQNREIVAIKIAKEISDDVDFECEMDG